MDSQRPRPSSERTNQQQQCLTSHTLTFTANTLQASLSVAFMVRTPRCEGCVLLFIGNHYKITKQKLAALRSCMSRSKGQELLECRRYSIQISTRKPFIRTEYFDYSPRSHQTNSKILQQTGYRPFPSMPFPIPYLLIICGTGSSVGIATD